MSAFVLDTNAALFYAGGMDRRLGKRARAVFAAFDAGEAVLHVPVPVVQETWFLRQRRGIAPVTPRAFWKRLERAELIFTELTHEDVLVASELDWDHRDPYDRLIVATALRLDLPLVTADEEITLWGRVEVVW